MTDHARADHCDCEESGFPPGLEGFFCCGKPECHRTKIAMARISALARYYGANATSLAAQQNCAAGGEP